jgi:hypothetical protein
LFPCRNLTPARDIQKGNIMAENKTEKKEAKPKVEKALPKTAYLCGVIKSISDELKPALIAAGWIVEESRTLSKANGKPDLLIVWNPKVATAIKAIEYAKHIRCKTVILKKADDAKSVIEAL